MAKSSRESFRFIDNSIRKGKDADARLAIRERMKRKLERGDLVSFSRLARRADLALLGLRLLNPIVRADRKKADASE